MNIINFTPKPASTVGFAVTTASANKAVFKGVETDLMIYNQGTTDCYVEWGDSSVAAVVTTGSVVGSMCVPAGSLQVLRGLNFAGGSLYVAAITASGTTTLLVTPGNGS